LLPNLCRKPWAFHARSTPIILLWVMEGGGQKLSTRIDVGRLRQLAQIVRHCSFSKAAESVGISQPALSKNIRSLERALGVQLLERGRFGAIPTAFGLALVRHADSIDAELRSATQEIEALRVA